MEQNGFSPYIDRYINSLKGSKRQELINQLSQLQPKDLEKLEAKLKSQYEYDSFNFFKKQDYMALNGMNEEEYEMKKGGYLRMMQKAGEVLPENGVNRMTLYNESGQESYINEPTSIGNTRNTPIEYYAQEKDIIEPLLQTASTPISRNFELPVVTTTPSPIVIERKSASVNPQDLDVKGTKKILDKADKVKVIQRRLRDEGITDSKGNPIEVDGIFGKKTKEAVEEFQKRNKLDVDGIVGARTKMALGLTNLGKEVIRPIGYKPPIEIPTEGDNKRYNNTSFNNTSNTKQNTKTDPFRFYTEEELRSFNNTKLSPFDRFEQDVNTLLSNKKSYSKNEFINYLKQMKKPDYIDPNIWDVVKTSLINKRFGN